MLAVAPSRNTTNDHDGIEAADVQFGGCSGFTINPEEFPEFNDHGSILESIDFDDLFDDSDILPDLEIDPDIFTDFSGSSSMSDNNNNNNNSIVYATYGADIDEKSVLEKGDEVVSKREDNDTMSKTVSSGGTKKESGEKKRKYSSSGSASNQLKRKVKVDWTPELHKRFVQAVEQLGVDKAVPSRILELMGVHCLTRHNVASHLQKYRSHRKHLLAREAEAANWTHKRQMYGAAAAAAGGRKNVGGGSALMAPTIGFPPPIIPAPIMHHHHRPHYAPLHVWGHPTVDQSLMQNIWPKHLAHSGSTPPAAAYPPMWVPPSPMWIPSISSPGSPRFVQPLAAPTTRFGTPPVPGFPPPPPPHHGMYKAAPAEVGLQPGKPGPPPPADFSPSKESIDAAIGDALTKPWLPFPLGLKPPAVDSVMVELHRHGVSMVPPADQNPKRDKKEKN